jgi:TrpR-related protein YerC/YecD
MKTWQTLELKKLAKAFLVLEKESDVLNFLRDLCTLEELEAFSRRWQVVELLNKGISYRLIAEKTGVSTATVTRIAHWLTSGEGGYRAVIEKLLLETGKSRQP